VEDISSLFYNSNPLFLSVKIEIIHRNDGYGKVEAEDEREAVAETGMLGLVMPDFHAEKSTDTAAKESDGYEAGFRDTPFVMPRLPFVNAIEKKGKDIDCREVEQESI
jgi:hypothetical protein